MAKNSKRKFTALKVILIIITILCYISAFVLRNYTMVNFPIVMGVCALAGLLIALLTVGPLASFIGFSNYVENVCVIIIIINGWLAGIFMTTNFVFSSSDTRHEEKAVIINKYKETRYRSKRVGRNRYVRGEPYYEYYATVDYGNGIRKPMLVNVQRYQRLNAGDTITVNMERGLFGFPVVKR